MRSTKLPHKTTPKRAAKALADEMERTGRELRNTVPDERWFASRLESMMRLANVASPRKRTTWKGAAENWLTAKTSKASSLTKYRTDVAHFTKWLGARANHDLRDITADDIATFHRAMRDSGFSETTAIAVVGAVRSVLRRAVLLRQIEANPAELLTFQRGGGDSKRRSFTPAEIKAILAVADKEWRVVCLFGLYYGMRISDAIRRNYEEIEGGVLRFVPQKKSRRGKVVAVPLVGELAALNGRGPITPSLHGVPTSVASKRFIKLLEKAGVERKKTAKEGKGRGVVDATFHSWRHTTNSLLLDAGVDQRVRQLICDHDSTKISNNYTHASIATMAKAIEPLANLAK